MWHGAAVLCCLFPFISDDERSKEKQVVNRHKNNSITDVINWVIFFVYLVFLTYFLFFAELMGRTQVQDGYSYNLVLFKEIKRFIKYYHLLGFKAVFLNLAGNVIGFIPFGFMLPRISERVRTWYLTLLLSFAFSLMVETVQLIWHVGSFDVDDLLLNTIGGVLGYVAYQIFSGKKK